MPAIEAELRTTSKRGHVPMMAFIAAPPWWSSAARISGPVM